MYFFLSDSILSFENVNWLVGHKIPIYTELYEYHRLPGALHTQFAPQGDQDYHQLILTSICSLKINFFLP